jgi:Domain of unknown function (DUF697)
MIFQFKLLKNSQTQALMRVLTDLVFSELQYQIQKPHNMNQEEKREKADSIILSHVGFAASAALLPLPIADIAAVGAVQLNMMRQLATLYRLCFVDQLGKNVITALVTSNLSLGLGRWQVNF